MAKQNCAICGAEVNLLQQQKLADGNYICRKVCAKKAMGDFDFVSATLYSVKEHIIQVEDGTKIYQKLFVKHKPKPRCPGSQRVLVAEDLGLIAKVDYKRKGLFSSYPVACIYRIADLYGWEYEEGTKVSMAGAASGQKTSDLKKVKYVHYYFWDTPGMSDFLDDIGGAMNAYSSLEKYYNQLFGIQKTLGNIKETWKNQIGAIKAAGSAIKAAATGSENLEAKAGEAANAMDRAQYGDRTEWIAKADAALRGV